MVDAINVQFILINDVSKATWIEFDTTGETFQQSSIINDYHFNKPTTIFYDYGKSQSTLL